MPTPEEIAAAQALLAQAEADKAAAKAAEKAAEEDPADDDDDDEEDQGGKGAIYQSNDPEELKQALKTVRREEYKRRQSQKKLGDELKETRAKLVEKETLLTEQQKKKLQEDNDLKGLLDLTTKESEEAITSLQNTLVNQTVEKALLEVGIDTKYLKMLNLNGIAVDKKGNITGVEKVVNQFKKDFPELVGGKAKQSADDGEDDEAEKKINPMDKGPGAPGWIPASELKKIQSLASGGKTPPEAGAAKAKKAIRADERPRTLAGSKEAKQDYEEYRKTLNRR